MTLNLRDLEYFVAIAEQKHFGRASRTLNVSQPTLSMQFKKLEESIGAKLVERLPRDVILTALGEELLPLARQVLSLASSIEHRCGQKETLSGVRLGVIPTIAPYLLPKITGNLSKAIQGRKFTLTEAQTSELVRMVKDGTLDAAILSTPLGERGVEEIDIFVEPFYLAVNNSNPLAKRKRVNLNDVKNERLLLLGEGHCLRNQALSICNIPQSGNDSDLSATSIETLRSMVAMGSGVTLMPKLAVRKEAGISYIPFTDSTTSRRVGIIFRPSFCDQDFIKLLKKTIESAAEKDKMSLVSPSGRQ